MGSSCSCVMDASRGAPSIQEVQLNVLENAKAHRTDKFNVVQRSDKKLVVRRGQEFKVTLKLDKEFNADKYILNIVFKTGTNPKFNNGTLVKLNVDSSSSCKTTEWIAWSEDLTTGKNEINLFIGAASDTIVAEWSVEFQIFHSRDVDAEDPPDSFLNVPTIFILYNPWCHTDSVYMKDEAKINEYVLNDLGKIWRGINSSFRGMIWNYGQFEPGILEASMTVLEKSPRLKLTKRGNPIFVCRDASAMVNSNDGDNGIVVGNWSGEYEDGKSPSAWQGSVDILDEWMSTNAPVRYGQCWVFAGVLTTVMRALGIPCRPITNFESAHDTDATITHDIHVDLEGNKLEEGSDDSIWNFHVWNEVWMSRPDLPEGYGGWQVIDSTPQERSDGIFQAGPASVTAVRKGEVGMNYDSAFVFAEVNADKVTWLSRGKDEPLEVLNIDTKGIGQFISTKRPGPVLTGNKDRRDITHRYKAMESSLEERMTIVHALNAAHSAARNIYQKSERRDVKSQITVGQKMPRIGEDFKLNIKIQNTSTERRTLEAIVKLDSMLYTGALHKAIKRQKIKVELEPEEERDIEVTVRGREYMDKLVDQASLQASAFLKVSETDQVLPTEYNFRFKLPKIDLQAPQNLHINETTKLIAHFTNPLGISLTNGMLKIEGPGIKKRIFLPVESIAPQEKIEFELNVTPQRPGVLTLLASFCSKELWDVNGSTSIKVD